MELNWSTFVLEIINFLVLVWILERLLYKPVLAVIARRRAGIEKTLADSKALQAEAERLKAQYECRLGDWERERQKARDALSRELEAERTRKMSELQSALEQERDKARVAEARRQADALHKMEETALLQSARFATRLLEQASGPDTEARLVDLTITELSRLPAERVADLRSSFGRTSQTIMVESAFPLSDHHRKGLEQALTAIAGTERRIRYEQNSELLAGVRITIGAWMLGTDLRHELKGFIELAHES
jgi:F-type H+-transporting ATPase subunit b